MRLCIGCRTSDRKSALVRIAVVGQTVVWDEAGRLGGRGGYLHPRRECLERFMKLKVERFTSLRRGIHRAERETLVKKLLERLATDKALE